MTTATRPPIGIRVEKTTRLSLDLSDLERRYQLEPGTIGRETAKRAEEAHERSLATQRLSGYSYGGTPVNRVDPDAVLLALPETEFFTAIEHAVDLGLQKRLFGGYDDFSGFEESIVIAERFFEYVDRALSAHGVAYRRAAGERRFEWVGDPKQRELTVQPALLALADQRLAGARAEFEEALHKRRGGTSKELEDAVDEAAKSVESILQILHHELGVTPPRSQQVTPLLNSLVTANKIPNYVDKLIAAASGPRNNMASHGQGTTVRQVPEELADASIAAATTAITLLAHYLP